MARPYCSASNLDFGPKRSFVGHCETALVDMMYQRPQHVFHVSGTDCKTAPSPSESYFKAQQYVLFQQSVKTSSLENACRGVIGCPVVPSHRGKEAYRADFKDSSFSREPYPAMVSMESFKSAPWCGMDYNCNFLEDLSQAPLTKPSEHTHDSFFFQDDVDGEKTPKVFAALVNQLLDEADDDIVLDFQPSEESQGWFLKNVSVGELAIKLADLALNETCVPAIQQLQSMPQNDFNKTYFNHDLESKALSKELLNVEGTFKDPNQQKVESANRKKTNLHNRGSSSTKKSSEMSTADQWKKKKNPVKFSHWSRPQSMMNPSTHRNAVHGDFTNKTKVKHPNDRLSNKFTFVSPHTSNRKTSVTPAPKRITDSSNFCMQHLAVSGSTGSKSDGSSSSNSSVHRESIHQPSLHLAKYEVFSRPHDKKNPTTFGRRRSCIAHSVSSSSSGSQGKYKECVFCKTNGETSAVYRSHTLKDEHGRTTCGVLQKYICPLCGATGFESHTVKYCPLNTNPPPIATMTTLKAMRSSTGKRRHSLCAGQIRPVPFNFNLNLLPA